MGEGDEEEKRRREEEAGGDDGIWGKIGWAVGDKTIWPLEANGGEWSKGRRGAAVENQLRLVRDLRF